MKKGLEWLLSSFEKDEFFKNHYEKKHLLLQDRGDYYSSIFDLDDFDISLSQGNIGLESIEITNGNRASHEKWTTFVRHQGVELSLGKIRECIMKGDSLIVNGLQEYFFHLSQFVANLGCDLSGQARANAYITPPSAQAFLPHYDLHDVFVLQISGAKEWKIYPKIAELPHPLQKNTTAFFSLSEYLMEHSFIVQPGDLLYIPRGVGHEAISSDNLSVHISIGITSFTGTDLAIKTIQNVSEQLFFRKSVFDEGKEVSEEYLDEFKRHLIQRISNYTTEELISIANKEARLEFRQKEIELPLLQEQIGIERLKSSDMVSVIKGDDYRLITKGLRLQIKLGNRGTAIEIPLLVKPLVDKIIASKEKGITIKDLGNTLNGQDITPLVKLLLRNNIFTLKKNSSLETH